MKFSFDFPEPSVAFEGFEFSFRVFTQENTYSLAADHLAVRASDNGLEISVWRAHLGRWTAARAGARDGASDTTRRRRRMRSRRRDGAARSKPWR